jgi:SAM-dependent methyltransferase
MSCDHSILLGGGESVADQYHDDLAYIHDAGYGGHARSAAPVILQALRRVGVAGGLVIDLGCGSGILAAEVSAAGYDVLGFDISASMIALARKRAPQAKFRRESFVTAQLPQCVAVAAVGEIFNYLFDQGNTCEALSALFRRIHAALRPGGLLMFDVAEPGRVPGSGPQRNFREGDDWAALVAAEEDRSARLLTRRITSFRKVGKLYRRDFEVHRLRLLDGPALAAQLREIGFRVRIVRGYGPARLPPGYVGLLARKPE